MTANASVLADIPAAPRLKRALKLRDLVLYGVIIVCPISPAPFFGALIKTGHGHAALTILIALPGVELASYPRDEERRGGLEIGACASLRSIEPPATTKPMRLTIK